MDVLGREDPDVRAERKPKGLRTWAQRLEATHTFDAVPEGTPPQQVYEGRRPNQRTEVSNSRRAYASWERWQPWNTHTPVARSSSGAASSAGAATAEDWWSHSRQPSSGWGSSRQTWGAMFGASWSNATGSRGETSAEQEPEVTNEGTAFFYISMVLAAYGISLVLAIRIFGRRCRARRIYAESTRARFNNVGVQTDMVRDPPLPPPPPPMVQQARRMEGSLWCAPAFGNRVRRVQTCPGLSSANQRKELFFCQRCFD